MTGDDRYKLFGVYVSQPVADSLASYLYEEAGVIDFENYFDTTADFVPVGDPGADVTDTVVRDLLGAFARLYDDADFESAGQVDSDAFVLAHLAARPQRVSDLRERFRAAATIQETDLRTVQTAIIDAYLESSESDRLH